jgi:diguanylate cyclase (GGDEF)-like protein
VTRVARPARFLPRAVCPRERPRARLLASGRPGDEINTTAHNGGNSGERGGVDATLGGTGAIVDRAPDPVLGSAFSAWSRHDLSGPRKVGSTIVALVAEQSIGALWIECATLTLLIAVIDYYTSSEFSFSIFYMGPIVFAAWFISRRAGILLSLVSVGLWGWLDVIAGVVHSNPIAPVWNALVRLGFYVTALELVARTKAFNERESLLARTDSLTGVANGRAFADRTHLALNYLRRAGRPLTVAYIDLDHFKEVNDGLGHAEGDRLLHAVAQAVSERLRSTDMVARLGGDEFGVLLADTDAAMAPKVLAVIAEAINEAVDGEWGVGCTIGAVTFTSPPSSVDFMVGAADQLMFRGKQEGRGRVVHEVWSGE